ncbi:MAG: ribosome maturation factor RimP [Candidatus Ventricola sp.]
MAQSDLNRVVEPACRRLAKEQQVELVDVELVREGASRYLRIYIDKPDGITLNDCETYHRAVMPLVERVDYDFLEVCSPGLDRPLKTQRDFDAHIGDLVEVHLYRAVDRCRRFEGELLGLAGDQVSLRIGEEERRFALREISLCKPVIVVTEEDLADGRMPDAGDEEGEASDDGQE